MIAPLAVACIQALLFFGPSKPWAGAWAWLEACLAKNVSFYGHLGASLAKAIEFTVGVPLFSDTAGFGEVL
jgi:hypothetical protein